METVYDINLTEKLGLVSGGLGHAMESFYCPGLSNNGDKLSGKVGKDLFQRTFGYCCRHSTKHGMEILHSVGNQLGNDVSSSQVMSGEVPTESNYKRCLEPNREKLLTSGTKNEQDIADLRLIKRNGSTTESHNTVSPKKQFKCQRCSKPCLPEQFVHVTWKRGGIDETSEVDENISLSNTCQRPIEKSCDLINCDCRDFEIDEDGLVYFRKRRCRQFQQVGQCRKRKDREGFGRNELIKRRRCNQSEKEYCGQKQMEMSTEIWKEDGYADQDNDEDGDEVQMYWSRDTAQHSTLSTSCTRAIAKTGHLTSPKLSCNLVMNCLEVDLHHVKNDVAIQGRHNEQVNQVNSSKLQKSFNFNGQTTEAAASKENKKSGRKELYEKPYQFTKEMQIGANEHFENRRGNGSGKQIANKWTKRKHSETETGKPSVQQRRKCWNCKTEEARRCSRYHNGEMVCSACKRYWERRKEDRPPRLWGRTRKTCVASMKTNTLDDVSIRKEDSRG